jgi:hypothetical protein
VRRLWEGCFPDEPFMPPYLIKCSWEEEEAARRQRITSYVGEMGRAAFKSRIAARVVEIVAAAQRTFLWQVVAQRADVLDGHADEELCETNEWLGRAWDRYLLFLALCKRAGPDGAAALVPMSDINVVWHAHLSCSADYKRDCVALLGFVLDHDTVAVEERRHRRTQALLEAAARTADGSGSEADVRGRADLDDGGGGGDDEDGVESLGLPSVELAEMDDAEIEALVEKRRRGISIRATKQAWEAAHGAHPKYDLPDTCYRGEPEGERGGFHAVFTAANGTARDISWVRALALMVLATCIAAAGLAVAAWAFARTMLTHGKYLLGIPAGAAVAALGVYAFLAIPINRPLSSDARYWLDRNLKQTHNPLPPYLISSTKKGL